MKKWSRQTEPSRYQSAVERFAPSNPAAIPCNPRRAPTPRCHQITNAEEMSKTPTIRPAVRLRETPRSFSCDRGGAYSGKQKIRKQETIAATMDQLMQICNLRCNGREATARLSNLWTLIRNDRIDISLVFLFSWIPDLLLALGRNAFADSNSNRSPDL